MQDLGTLGGTSSDAWDINASGQVVGASGLTGDSAFHAYFYSGGIMKDLGTLGGKDSEACGINAGGQVVGYSWLDGDSVRHAFLWSGGVMTDLNTLLPSGSGWTLEVANAINDLGQIVCNGYNNEGVHALLLTPVPEPMTLGLLALGGLSLLRRKSPR